MTLPSDAPAAEIAKWIAGLELDLAYLEERAERESAAWAKIIRDKRVELSRLRALHEIKRRGERGINEATH